LSWTIATEIILDEKLIVDLDFSRNQLSGVEEICSTFPEQLVDRFGVFDLSWNCIQDVESLSDLRWLLPSRKRDNPAEALIFCLRLKGNPVCLRSDYFQMMNGLFPYLRNAGNDEWIHDYSLIESWDDCWLMNVAFRESLKCPPKFSSSERRRFDVGAVLFYMKTASVLVTGYSREIDGENLDAVESALLKFHSSTCPSSAEEDCEVKVVCSLEPCGHRLIIPERPTCSQLLMRGKWKRKILLYARRESLVLEDNSGNFECVILTISVRRENIRCLCITALRYNG
jgi:pyrimidine deaminase RibD-like protein